MAGSRFIAVKRALSRRFVLIVPVWGQKVKGIGPGPFEELVRSREKEPAGPTDRAIVAAGFRHEVDTRLEQL